MRKFLSTLLRPDAAADLSPSMETICLIVDFDGFNLSRRRGFVPREIGYVAMDSDQCDLLAFDLSPLPIYLEDSKTIRYCRKYIHGLSFHPKLHERNLYPIHRLDDLLRQLYAFYATPQKNRVAFKGGSCEKLKLEELGIPHLDLEKYGCPKYEDVIVFSESFVETENPLRMIEYRRWSRANHSRHLHDRRKNGYSFYCPLEKVRSYKEWVVETLRLRKKRKNKMIAEEEEARMKRILEEKEERLKRFREEQEKKEEWKKIKGKKYQKSCRQLRK